MYYDTINEITLIHMRNVAFNDIGDVFNPKFEFNFDNVSVFIEIVDKRSVIR